MKTTFIAIAAAATGLLIAGNTFAPQAAEARPTHDEYGRPICNTLTRDPGRTCALGTEEMFGPGAVVSWTEWVDAKRQCNNGSAPQHACRMAGIF